MPNLGNWRARLLNLGLLVIALLLLAGTAEILCRLFLPDRRIEYDIDPDLLFVYKPNQVGIEGNPPITYRINELGLRGPGLDAIAGRRILFLGDSFTMGSLVAEPETFVGRLDRSLPNGLSAINGGRGGYGIYQIETLARRLMPIVQPEAVVLVIWQGLLLRQPLPDAEKMRVLSRSASIKRLKSISVLGTHLYRAWERAALRIGATSAVITLGHHSIVGESQKDQFAAALEAESRRLEDLATSVRSAGARFMIVFWPAAGYSSENGHPLSDEIAGRLKDLALELEVPFLQLGTAFSQFSPASLMIAGDGHPTVFAHCVVAGALSAEFARLGWFEMDPITCGLGPLGDSSH